VRILPDSPSVDFLRQEAKDLLVAIRETAPTASLADAQRTLAEQYGFRAWTDLKAEVERRRDVVPAPPPGLDQELAAAFDLGEVTGSMAPVAFQYMGRRWCLTTTRGRWSVAPVFNWISNTQAELGADLRERARAAGVASPVPVRAADGQLLKTVQGENWSVDEWIEVGPAPMPPVSSAVAGQAGATLAAIHGSARRTDAPVGWFLSHRKPEADWQRLVDRARDAKKPFTAEIEAFRAEIAGLHSITAEVPDERIVSICDFTPEAVRLGARRELVVMHWAYAGANVPEWEIAYCLMQWTVQRGVNVNAARAFIEKYGQRAGRIPSLDLSSFVLGVTGWLNWSYNQICEAIDPETPERADFSVREMRELFKDPLTTVKLERVLDALAPAMG
jgi:hypothetical protein